MDKKNYSVVVAIALIAILFVAMICVGCSKKNHEDIISDAGQTTENSGEQMLEIPDVNANIEWTEDGTKVNVSSKINKEKMSFGEIDLEDIKFEFANGITVFKANIKNNSDKDYPTGMEVKIAFYDNKGNLIIETYGLTNTLLAHSESNIYAQILTDCSYAEYIEVTIVE